MAQYLVKTTGSDGSSAYTTREGTAYEAANPVNIPVDPTTHYLQLGLAALVGLLIGSR